MLEKRMYVRFPADAESISDPRVFMCGQIAEIDEFKKTVTIKIHDPFEYLQFFENYPKNKVELPIQAVDHCGMFIGSDVMVHGKICTVRTRQKDQEGYFAYYAAAFVFRPMYTELKRLVNYYAQNENELFASAMTNWASLAGFKGLRSDEDLVTYTAESFSLKAAFNSQLIPPRWNDYLMEEQNKFVTSVQDEYDRNHQTKNPSRAIRGTFTRKRAIENQRLKRSETR